MNSDSNHQNAPTAGENVLAGTTLIVLLGIGLGLAYNQLGRSGGGWGLDWVGREATADLATLPVGGGPGSGGDSEIVTDVDDPLAIAGVGGALSEIPDLDRPIQIELDALKRYYDSGSVVLVDARAPEEFAEGHIAGAINLPYESVVTDPVRLGKFDPGEKAIVTYCGGGSCEMSIQLAQELLFHGHRKVLVFMGGFPAWVEAGHPVRAGAEG